MKLKFYSVFLGSLFSACVVSAGLPEALSALEEKKYDEALSEFAYLAEEGNSTAIYYLGKMYADGLGVPADQEKALEYFKLADSVYNADASLQLAKFFLADPDQEKYKDLGIQYLKKAAYAGNAEALFELGNLYTDGVLVEKEYVYAFGYYLMAALKGDKKAQHKLSICYFLGRGIPQDYENGLKWLSKSANQGYVLAQKDLADLRTNDPRLQNLTDAYAWYSIIAAYNTDEVGREAAEQRDKLANALKKTSQILEVQRKARNWRPISAEQSVSKEDLISTPTPVIPGFNDPATLQQMLEAGDTLITDGSRYDISEQMVETALKEQNFEPLEKAVAAAAEKGLVDVYGFYGDFVQTRLQDPKAALTWYRKGAEANEAYAQYQLAKMYCEGNGMETPDAVQCYSWLLISARHQNSRLKPAIEQAILAVEAEATPEEIEKGKALSEKFGASGDQKEAARQSSAKKFDFF